MTNDDYFEVFDLEDDIDLEDLPIFSLMNSPLSETFTCIVLGFLSVNPKQIGHWLIGQI